MSSSLSGNCFWLWCYFNQLLSLGVFLLLCFKLFYYSENEMQPWNLLNNKHTILCLLFPDGSIVWIKWRIKMFIQTYQSTWHLTLFPTGGGWLNPPLPKPIYENAINNAQKLSCMSICMWIKFRMTQFEFIKEEGL